MVPPPISQVTVRAASRDDRVAAPSSSTAAPTQASQPSPRPHQPNRLTGQGAPDATAETRPQTRMPTIDPHTTHTAQPGLPWARQRVMTHGASSSPPPARNMSLG